MFLKLPGISVVFRVDIQFFYEVSNLSSKQSYKKTWENIISSDLEIIKFCSKMLSVTVSVSVSVSVSHTHTHTHTMNQDLGLWTYWFWAGVVVRPFIWHLQAGTVASRWECNI